MILTLTLNPAVDVAISTDRIVYDDRSYITQESKHAGGKGINAAQVIHSFGGAVHAIAPSGGQNGARFRNLIEASGISATLIEVEGETCRNIAITDQQGLTIKLDEIGPPLSGSELRQIESAVEGLLPRAEWLMLTGSQPPGVPDDFYQDMITRASAQGVKTLLDTTGLALRLGLKARPTLAKPNRPEAERLLDRTLLSQAQSSAAAREIQELGAEHVIVSLGSLGAVAATGDELLSAAAPGFQTGCPIGAGDVLAATCVWSLSLGRSFPEAFRWAVAAATAASSLPGISFAPLEDVEKTWQKVEVRSI